MVRIRPSVRLVLASVLAASALPAQRAITTPEQFFGHAIGADHFLANYTELGAYWRKLASESDRMVLEEIGTTSYGLTMLMAVISSPQNLARRDEYRDAARQLCVARGLTDESARALARDGRAVVWIDGGLHATEAVAGQNIIELVYRMNAQQDRETLRILDEAILLVTPANPDGMEMIANAYRATRRVGNIPVLYQRYIGHDNNRDFYMSTQPETKAINRVLYERWFPQIVYNHHQSAPRGTIIFTPPFRDPFNYHFDPLVVRGIELVSAHMNARFAAENKPGVVSRTGAQYSTWWNGGLRTTSYFHNMIGILTETFGRPEPTEIEPALRRRLPNGDHPMPVPAQTWHARQTIEYLQTANFAILDLASRYREELLFNIYQMGRNAILRGSGDHWTPTPRLIAEAERREEDRRALDAGGETGAEPSAVAAFADPLLRDPRAFVLSSEQPDGAAAARFVTALLDTGVEVHRATAAFEVNGARYPAGSFVVFTAQAFRPHVMDMFEPQWHPDDVAGGEPVPPYDGAGWTPALSMDLQFDRILVGFDGPFQRVERGALRRPGTVEPGRGGWLMSHGDSASYVATNRLLRAGDEVCWLAAPWRDGERTHPAGAVFVPAKDGTRERIAALAADLGVDFAGAERAPDVAMHRLAPRRIGLFDVYGGDIETGWTQWLLEQFEFRPELVFGQRIHDGELQRDFDVLVFHAGLPFPRGEEGRVQRALSGGAPSRVSPEDVEKLAAALPPFEDWSTAAARLVRLDPKLAMPALRAFVEDGGVVLALGDQAAALIAQLELPIKVGAFVSSEDGEERRASRSEFFIPTSLLRAEIDPRHVLGYGASPELAMVFRSSPIFELQEQSAGIEVVASWARDDVLASGWALGAERVAGRPAVLAARLGKGAIYLYAADVVFRGQPQGSFKLLFNAILAGGLAAQ